MRKLYASWLWILTPRGVLIWFSLALLSTRLRFLYLHFDLVARVLFQGFENQNHSSYPVRYGTKQSLVTALWSSWQSCWIIPGFLHSIAFSAIFHQFCYCSFGAALWVIFQRSKHPQGNSLPHFLLLSFCLKFQNSLDDNCGLFLHLHSNQVICLHFMFGTCCSTTLVSASVMVYWKAAVQAFVDGNYTWPSKWHNNSSSTILIIGLEVNCYSHHSMSTKDHPKILTVACVYVWLNPSQIFG